MHLSTQLAGYLVIYVCIYIKPTLPTYLPAYASTQLAGYVVIYVYIYIKPTLPTYLPAYLPTCPPIDTSSCLHVYQYLYYIFVYVCI